MLSTIAATRSRIARMLCLALTVLSDPAAIAAENPGADMSAADYDAKMRDFDTQMRNILNTPVDLCNPAAVDAQGLAYYTVYGQKRELRIQREKIHPTIAQAAKAAADTFADEGLLADDLPIVEDYEATIRRGDKAAADTLMKKMKPLEQVQAAEWQHNYTIVFKILTPMADQGDVKAQRRLALIYSWATNFNTSIPSPTPRDDALAFKYARLASLNGDEIAQEVLAKAFACGFGTAKDLVKAYAWFSIAISQSALMLNTDDEPKVLLRRRNFLAGEMSHDDVQRAKHLVIQCYKSGYKNCD